MIRLDIFADPVCPWCYLGKANLDRALATRPDHPFVIQWHPFQLNPDMPPEGADKRSYLEARFGNKGQLDAVHERLREMARAAGVEMNPDKPQRIPNTLDSHRLIHWAGIEGVQSEVMTALMRAYWVDGKDIGDHQVLADVAASQGMNRDEVLRLLASDADADDLQARDEDARRKGVSAVPTFLVAQKYVVSGAQPTETWEKVIDEISGKAAS